MIKQNKIKQCEIIQYALKLGNPDTTGIKIKQIFYDINGNKIEETKFEQATKARSLFSEEEENIPASQRKTTFAYDNLNNLVTEIAYDDNGRNVFYMINHSFQNNLEKESIHIGRGGEFIYKETFIYSANNDLIEIDRYEAVKTFNYPLPVNDWENAMHKHIKEMAAAGIKVDTILQAREKHFLNEKKKIDKIVFEYQSGKSTERIYKYDSFGNEILCMHEDFQSISKYNESNQLIEVSSFNSGRLTDKKTFRYIDGLLVEETEWNTTTNEPSKLNKYNYTSN